MPDTKWSFFENGMPGLHLTINPQTPLPVEAQISRQFVSHGVTLTSDELQTILSSRGEGIATLNTLMGNLLPGFTQDQRLKFSTQIADALLNKSLAAQLSREAPTTFDRLQQRDEMLRHVFQQNPPPGTRRAPAPTLMEQVPIGVSVTLHF